MSVSFKHLVGHLRKVLAELPDRRKGKNLSYGMEAFGLSAFSVFFTQSPSFLAHQKAMQAARGQNNAQSFFQIQKTPSDNQIRQMLDPVPPQALYPVYDQILESLRDHGILQAFRGVNDSTLIALDGTWYHSSQNIHCSCCSHLQHKSGQITYYHSAVTPVIVAPGQSEVIALRPEFITPQDLPACRQAATPSRIAKSPPPSAGWNKTPLAISMVAPSLCWATTSTPINPHVGARFSTVSIFSSPASPSPIPLCINGSTCFNPAPTSGT